MTLGVSSITMQGVGEVKKLSATFKDGETREVTWESSDTKVAVVDENGYVDAVGVGTAVITAKAMDGETELTASCIVNVEKESVAVQKGQFTDVSGNTEEVNGETAPASHAADGNDATFWHSEYYNQRFTVSETNPAILTLTLKDGAEAFNAIQIVQRPSGENGLVQKVKYIIGNSYDAEAGTVGDVVEEGTVTVKNTTAGAAESILLEKAVTAKYIQIQVLQGNNGYAAIGEVKTCNIEVHTSLAEEQNAVDEAEKSLTQASDAVAEKEAALDAAKEALENADTELAKAEAEVAVAQAQLDVQNAKVAEAEAQKVLATAQKALAIAKAEKNGDNDEIVERENEKALNADQAAVEATGKFDELTAEVSGLETQLNAVKLKAAATRLDDTLKTAEAVYTAGQQKYTDETWAAFEKAYKAALDGKASADLAEVEGLQKALADAQAALTDKSQEELDLIAAKGEVSEALKAAEAVYAAGGAAYTEASWKAFADAYAAAKNPAANADAAALKALAEALKKAQGGLAKAAAPSPAPNPTPTDELKKGDTVTVKNVVYKVTNADKKTVAAVKGKNKKLTSVSIASTVKVKGETCKVTAVNAKAFKGYARLKKVTIGKNVTTVGKQAFYGCKKLTKVSFKGTAVKSIKSAAFKKANAKIKVTLPKKLKGKNRTKLVKQLKKAGIKSAK